MHSFLMIMIIKISDISSNSSISGTVSEINTFKNIYSLPFNIRFGKSHAPQSKLDHLKINYKIKRSFTQ